MMKGPVPMLMRLVRMPRILIRNPTYQSPLSVVQTLTCCPMQVLGLTTKGMAWCGHSQISMMLACCPFIDFLLQLDQ